MLTTRIIWASPLLKVRQRCVGLGSRLTDTPMRLPPTDDDDDDDVAAAAAAGRHQSSN